MEGPLAGAAGLALASALLAVPLTWVVKVSFDRLIPQGDLERLPLAALALVALAAGRAGLVLAARALSLRATKEAILRLRRALLRHMMDLPRLDRREGLPTLAVQDTERLDVMANALVTGVLPSAVGAATLAAWLLYLNPPLFGVVVAVAPLMLAVHLKLNPALRRRVAAFREAFEAFDSRVWGLHRRLGLVQERAAAGWEEERAAPVLERLRRDSSGMAWLETAYPSLQGLLSSAALAGLLAFGGVAVGRGWMTLGDLLAFAMATALLNQSLSGLLRSVPQVAAGLESWRALREELARAAPAAEGGRRLDFRGSLRLEGVSFGYGDQDLFRGVSLSLAPPEVVALTGPNGSGKSTLLAVMLGLLPARAGTVEVDGVPLQEVDRASLRRQVGVAAQEALVVPGTVADNLAYGLEGVSREDLERAAARVGLPWSLDQDLEGGRTLSAGERQRLALARALAGRPRLLLLDEPGNHLDGPTLERFLDGLAGDGCAVLLVSHDPRLLDRADRVLELREGRLESVRAVSC